MKYGQMFKLILLEENIRSLDFILIGFNIASNNIFFILSDY